MMRDYRDLPVSGATTISVDHFEQALAAFNCYAGNPVALVDAALEDAPDFVMAHALKAALMVSGSDAQGAAAARMIVGQAQSLPATPREQETLAAIGSLAHGAFNDAAQRFDALLSQHPRDLVALQIAHLYDFNRGDSVRLRDRPARSLAQFTSDLPGYHAVLGMHAFGLEESGDYDRALDQGHAALAANPKDAWAHHAVAHVFEMRGDQRRGIQWMLDRESEWSPDNMMAVHNWWHLALFHLDLGESDKTLALYDARINAKNAAMVLDLIDASALLWRLALRGIEVGDRWSLLADAWSAYEADDFYAFNNWHAVLAAVGAERWETVNLHLARLQRTLLRGGDNAHMAGAVALPLVRGAIHFARGEYSQAAEKFTSVQPVASQFGGSHAQRDLITLTLMESLRRAGEGSAVAGLAHERLLRKPGDRLARHYLEASFA